MNDTSMHVATFVAGPQKLLTEDCLMTLSKAIGGRQNSWLSAKKAADIFFTCGSSENAVRIVREILGDSAIDFFIQPAAKRKKKLLIADMESTIIEQEMLDELAGEVGLKEKIASITLRAMNGELDFADAVKERVSLLKGIKISVLEDMAGRMSYSQGALTLVDVMRRKGARCWLASGGFTCFTDKVVQEAGFHKAFANKLVFSEGMLSGDVEFPLFDKEGKKALIDLAVNQLGIDTADIICVGDGSNDVPMLKACHQGGGLGVAYRGKPNVRAQVHAQINYTDLTSLLLAQGYSWNTKSFS